MKIYLIVSGKRSGLSRTQEQKLKSVGELITITHSGKLSDIEELKNDQSEKILGLDPGSFDWKLDVEAFNQIPNVKAVITQSTSFDWLMPKELKEKHIIAGNCPGFSSDSVAEYALCMAIELARRFPLHLKNNWKIDWDTKGMLLKGKIAGIIGLGRIGSRMAQLCQGIGMNVIYWSRASKDNRFKYVELPELFKTADLIMPALVENDETKNLITDGLLSLVKPAALIVGINRVKVLLNEKLIIEKVEHGEIGGYAFEGENAKELSEYKGNILALPAIAWYTEDSLTNLLEMWANNLFAAAQNQPKNVVNS